MIKLQWATPEIDKQIMYMARVSNPTSQNSENTRLLHYCMEHGHVSPFEMANVCLEINTTRDIARQILRHRSFSFQEFSQRYAEVDKLPPAPLREARLQDTKNRQNSISVEDEALQDWWEQEQDLCVKNTQAIYQLALQKGIAKEVARAVLPEGLTTSRMYMNGTLRSWIHFYQLRSGNGTQKETRVIADEVGRLIEGNFPNIWWALKNET